MKRILFSIVFVLAATLLLRAQGAEQEILQIEEQLRQAALKGDTAAFDRLLASDYRTTNQFGLTRTKAQVIDDIKTGASKPAQSLELSNMKVRVYGDAAVLTAVRTSKGSQLRGRDTSGRAQSIRVYAKRQGRWQAVALQLTLMQE